MDFGIFNIMLQRNPAKSAKQVFDAPFKLRNSDGVATRAAPQLGADTEQVPRKELGYDDAQIERLRRGEAI